VKVVELWEHCKPHPGIPNIQGTFEEYAGNVQGTCSKHSRTIRIVLFFSVDDEWKKWEFD
jgi:hypothetical protein